MSKTKALVSTPTEEQLAILNNQFPKDAGFQRIQLPRIEMASQDKTEGKGKAMKVVTEAGTFFINAPGEEEDDNGKKVWEKEELGLEIEATVVYQRKQLRHYDSATETFTSSPVYDSNDQVIPLFQDKAEVERGTPKELQAIPRFQGVTAKGKPTSKLEEHKILYVLYKDELYEMNLRGTSLYAYRDYVKTLNPATVLTKFSSEPKENGAISWSQMTFETVKSLSGEEINEIIEKQSEIISGIQQEKAFFAAQSDSSTNAKKELDNF